MAERPSEAELQRFHGKRLVDRQIDELIGLARGLAADGRINQAEAEFLHAWLIANQSIMENQIVETLAHRVGAMLADGVLDDEEAAELLETLRQFSGDQPNVAVGELLKPTSLPLDNPAPVVAFVGVRFCFTGTFTTGPRADCEQRVIARGGEAGSLTKSTRYLVIGNYATDSWMHSSYGQKIERAVEMRTAGIPIAIICEDHWRAALGEDKAS